jgi:dCTP deaminase
VQLLSRNELVQSLADQSPESIFLDPLLKGEQVGAISVDLRLGYDFLVSVLTRRPAIEPYPGSNTTKRGIQSYFQETRRRVGDRFVLYPHQVVLSTTVEYLSLPSDICADVMVRSSYGRLGIGVSTMMQPGWRGSVPLELFNHGNTPIEMIVGSCICQARFYRIGNQENYVGGGARRKYFGGVRPTVSRADHDSDLPVLSRMGGEL